MPPVPPLPRRASAHAAHRHPLKRQAGSRSPASNRGGRALLRPGRPHRRGRLQGACALSAAVPAPARRRSSKRCRSCRGAPCVLRPLQQLLISSFKALPLPRFGPAVSDGAGTRLSRPGEPTPRRDAAARRGSASPHRRLGCLPLDVAAGVAWPAGAAAAYACRSLVGRGRQAGRVSRRTDPRGALRTASEIGNASWRPLRGAARARVRGGVELAERGLAVAPAPGVNVQPHTEPPKFGRCGRCGRAVPARAWPRIPQAAAKPHPLPRRPLRAQPLPPRAVRPHAHARDPAHCTQPRAAARRSGSRCEVARRAPPRPPALTAPHCRRPGPAREFPSESRPPHLAGAAGAAAAPRAAAWWRRRTLTRLWLRLRLLPLLRLVAATAT
eukprot:361505-Chlamydomonas_euryale.AAC.5